MSICSRMIILTLSIVLNYCLTKTSNLTLIRYHNVQLHSCWMFVTTSVRALLWHDCIHVCALTRFVPYPLHKFRLASLFSCLWLWHHSVLNLYHLLSTDYVRIRLVHFSSFFLCLYNVEAFFCIHGFVSQVPRLQSENFLIYFIRLFLFFLVTVKCWQF